MRRVLFLKASFVPGSEDVYVPGGVGNLSEIGERHCICRASAGQNLELSRNVLLTEYRHRAMPRSQKIARFSRDVRCRLHDAPDSLQGLDRQSLVTSGRPHSSIKDGLKTLSKLLQPGNRGPVRRLPDSLHRVAVPGVPSPGLRVPNCAVGSIRSDHVAPSADTAKT